MRYDVKDFAISNTGDIMLHKNDIATADKNNFLKQQIKNRLNGSNPSWFYDNICADLEQFIGAINNQTTANQCVDRIITSLSKDGLISASDIYVKATPISPRQIRFFIFINSPYDTTPIGLEVLLHLTSGISTREV